MGYRFNGCGRWRWRVKVGGKNNSKNNCESSLVYTIWENIMFTDSHCCLLNINEKLAQSSHGVQWMGQMDMAVKKGNQNNTKKNHLTF